ncbi:type I polyketide synthase [Parachitinimonas caeni]|uniref:Type I polyketide synthase n=1 Tax=Parachitinimonas caeni TaxID=3031301 RepID=A0ABT7DRQ2_9NEIS|nr:type I polyketide synthase [Parachitinimonas caeni]MDK2122752.1 type I polyketide synthase [Parachitinimonas caeni]
MNTPQTPIAVIGMACRLPGAPSLDAYWQLLKNGVDAISEVPLERWSLDEFYDPDPTASGKTTIRHGGFIEGVNRFDAAFFGISPRELIGVSPQQRLLLEVAWHAVENAGLSMVELSAKHAAAGRRTGVFMGVASFDYYDRVTQDPARIDGYSLTGNAYSVTANRLSYLFDLRGPSIALDTACSSSLVAIHLACQSLATGECTTALAGGVQLMLSPWVTVAASKGEFLAPDGRCKTFDARADGYARGEGIGVVVLKRLDEALRDGDPIWAVIRGSAVNQDGRSNGLTAPNPAAQVDVVATAWRRGQIAPDQVGYIEAHGTGTKLGDPMELNAMANVLGPRSQKCLVGSAKTNFGHLEAAAGVAGFIKAALCVHHGEIAPHLHFNTPNPLIDFERLPLSVATQHQPWPTGLPRIAGVSSFGFGGTNAHVVLEAGPAPRQSAITSSAALFCLSARSRPALAAQAEQLARWLQHHPAASLSAVASTLAMGRMRFTERRALAVTDTASAARNLTQLATELRTQPAGSRRPSKPKLAFVFTGQGAQYPGMGRGLYEHFPVFRDTWREADAILANQLGGPLSQLVYGHDANAATLAQTRYTQPAQYVLQVGLLRVLADCGLKPALLLGHSIGEFAAAHCAGVLSFEQGLRLVALRGASMQSCPAGGAMLAVQLDRLTATALLRQRNSQAVIAAVNGPRSIVLSGPEVDIVELEQALAQQAVGHRRLQVSHAFHSGAMAPAALSLRDYASHMPHGKPALPLISSLTAEPVGTDLDWPSYWAEQILNPVEFERAAARLAQEKPDLLLELGPQPVLSRLLQQQLGGAYRIHATLDTKVDDLAQLLTAIGAAYDCGIEPNPAGLFTADGGARPRLPGYPFEVQAHPLYPPVSLPQAGHLATPHAWLTDATVEQHGKGEFSVSLPLGSRRFGWLGDHTVFGADVLPATGYIELAQAAAFRITGRRRWQLEGLEFRRPLVLNEDDRRVRIDLAAEGDAWRFTVCDDDNQPTQSRAVYSCGLLRNLPAVEGHQA